MVRNLAFEAITAMLDGEAPVEPKLIKDLAIAIHRLERAASENVKREEEIRHQALEEAAGRVDEAAQQKGMTAEQADYWRKQVLGMS